MSDDTPGWFDDELEPSPGRHRRLVVATAVAIPWVVVAVVLVRGDGGAPTAPSDPGPVAAAPVPEPDPDTEPVADADADPGDEPADTAPEGRPPADGTTTGATAGAATAVAIAVTRAWLSDAGPDLEVPGIEPDRRAYLEHAVVRQLDLAADDAAVATVSVVLLTRDDDRFDDVLVRRVAVPLTLTATAVHPAGPPWWLTHDDLPEPRAPELAPTDDPALVEAAAAAITAAGYEDVAVTGVSRGGGDLVVASATGRLADGTELPRAVWLRDDGHGVVLLGGDAADDQTPEVIP